MRLRTHLTSTSNQPITPGSPDGSCSSAVQILVQAQGSLATIAPTIFSWTRASGPSEHTRRVVSNQSPDNFGTYLLQADTGATLSSVKSLLICAAWRQEEVVGPIYKFRFSRSRDAVESQASSDENVPKQTDRDLQAARHARTLRSESDSNPLNLRRLGVIAFAPPESSDQQTRISHQGFVGTGA